MGDTKKWHSRALPVQAGCRTPFCYWWLFDVHARSLPYTRTCVLSSVFIAFWGCCPSLKKCFASPSSKLALRVLPPVQRSSLRYAWYILTSNSDFELFIKNFVRRHSHFLFHFYSHCGSLSASPAFRQFSVPRSHPVLLLLVSICSLSLCCLLQPLLLFKFLIPALFKNCLASQQSEL